MLYVFLIFTHVTYLTHMNILDLTVNVKIKQCLIRQISSACYFLSTEF